MQVDPQVEIMTVTQSGVSEEALEAARAIWRLAGVAPIRAACTPDYDQRAAVADWARIIQVEWDRPKFNPANALKLVADSPERLRPVDLDRLFDSYWEHREILAAWLKQVRPDIAHKVDKAVASIEEELAECAVK
jgi:hypothetical protein